MAGNTLGKVFQISTFGESHGVALGVVVDGCPAGLKLNLEQIRYELNRRRPGQSKIVSTRGETEEFQILSGIFDGKTTGTPIAVVVYNQDARSRDYEEIKNLFRPGHADFGYFVKYQNRDYRGGGRSSARETIGRVVGGAIAKQLLATAGITIRGGLIQLGEVKANNYDWARVEENELRCVDPAIVASMLQVLEEVRKDRDSIGSILEVQALGVPVGLGEPVFERLDAQIAAALMSIPAVKGVEIGEGFKAATLRGSEMNDLMFPEGFKTNHHGGILGGISSGAPIVARVALKPTSSLPKPQATIDKDFNPTTITTLGRHDPCVGIRAVPVAEAMLAIVLADYWLIDCAASKAREGFFKRPEIKYGLSNGN